MYQLKWLWDRWRIMQHPQEEIYRINQFLQYFYRDKKWSKRLPALAGFRWNGLLASVYAEEDIRYVVEHTFGDIHAFKILNVTLADIVAHENWNYDIKNRLACARRFAHDINDFDYTQGEVKYVYELSRLYQMAPLAAYYVAKSDAAGMAGLKRMLRGWAEQNPFMYNVAWKSGNVVGIRAVNLIVFKSLLDLMGERDDEFERFFAELLELHYRFLVSHLSLYSSKGNHHIGELAGMIAISAAFDFEHSEKRLKAYVRELQEEALRLIYADGMNKEQAVRYQASYINLIMMSLMFAGRKGIPCEGQVQERMKAAYDFLAAMKIRHNCFFQVGDNDDAQLIYPYPDKQYDIYESMMNDRGILYGEVLDSDYHFDLRNYVLFGTVGLEKYRTACKQRFEPVAGARLYRESGYYVYSDSRLNVLFDVGRIGLLPTMSHGHSDMLSFQLYCDGNPVIVDTGSYQYNLKYRKLRDYFHGVHSHNTIAVAGLDQAVLGSGMFWLSNPSVMIEDFSADPAAAYCRACHTGYVRKGMNVLHHRSLSIQPDRVIVVDEVAGEPTEQFVFYLHFHPAADVTLSDNQLMVSCHGKLCVRLENELFHQGRLVKGDAETPMGWFSPSYDNIEATTSFVLECEMSRVKEMKTIISFQ